MKKKMTVFPLHWESGLIWLNSPVLCLKLEVVMFFDPSGSLATQNIMSLKTDQKGAPRIQGKPRYYAH